MFDIDNSAYTLSNAAYTVEIKTDGAYTPNSADNPSVSLVINPKNLGRNDMYKALRISIGGINEMEIILLVHSYAYFGDFAILSDETLTLLIENSIITVNLAQGSAKAENLEIFGMTYGIYLFDCGYIVHGEHEIVMLNFSYDIKWKFIGNDVFVSRSEKPAFEIAENSIKLTDFEDNCYKLDFNGNIIYSSLSE